MIYDAGRLAPGLRVLDPALIGRDAPLVPVLQARAPEAVKADLVVWGEVVRTGDRIQVSGRTAGTGGADPHRWQVTVSDGEWLELRRKLFAAFKDSLRAVGHEGPRPDSAAPVGTRNRRAYAHFIKARIPLGRGRADVLRKKSELEASLRRDGRFARARAELAFVLAQLGETERSEQLLKMIDPAMRAPAWFRLAEGFGHEQQGGDAEAMASYARAVAAAPQSARPRAYLGRVLVRVGLLARAEKALREAARLHPYYAVPHYHLGGILEGQNRTADAEAAYQEAVRLDPDHAGARCALGELYQRRGAYRRAAREYEAAIAVDPAYARPALRWAEILIGQADYRTAIQLCQDILKQHPSHSTAMRQIGVAHYCSRSYDDAKRWLLRGLKLDPDDAVGHHSLGLVYAATDNFAQARREHELALALDDSLVEARQALRSLDLRRERERSPGLSCLPTGNHTAAPHSFWPFAGSFLCLLIWRLLIHFRSHRPTTSRARPHVLHTS